MMRSMDWSQCPDVEQVAGRLSGQWVVRDTRIPVEALLDNVKDGFSAEEIAAQIYEGLPVERARRIIAFARQHETHPA
jgi:uncharacterized protein (DUF433 family)